MRSALIIMRSKSLITAETDKRLPKEQSGALRDGGGEALATGSEGECF